MGWSIDSYLEAVDKTIATTLEERVQHIPPRPPEVQTKSPEQLEEPKAPQDEQTAETRSGVVDDAEPENER